eukprot:g2784.t1
MQTLNVEHILQHEETALDIYKKVKFVPLRTGISFFEGVRIGSGSVIDICGEGSTGKTTLLLEIATNAVVKEKRCVVYVDMENKFDIFSFRDKIRLALDGTSSGEEEEEECLRRMNVVQCTTLAEFVSTFDSLRELFQRDATVLMIDSTDSSVLDGLANKSSHAALIGRALRFFRGLLADANVVIFFTRSNLFSSSDGVFASLVDCRVYLRFSKEEKRTRRRDGEKRSHFEVGIAASAVPPSFVARFSIGKEGIVCG